nr:immunoglobulin light chain junction region [Macaca mulatta]
DYYCMIGHNNAYWVF